MATPFSTDLSVCFVERLWKTLCWCGEWVRDGLLHLGRRMCIVLTIQPVEKQNDEFLRDEEYIFLLQKNAKRHPIWGQLATFVVS
jgi:hypothetical protein